MSWVWFCFSFLLVRTTTASQPLGSGFSDDCDNSSTYLLQPSSVVDSSITSIQHSVMNTTSTTAILTTLFTSSQLIVRASTVTSSGLSTVSSTQESSHLVRSTSTSVSRFIHLASTSIIETSSILYSFISIFAQSAPLISTTTQSRSPTSSASPSLTPTSSASPSLTPTSSVSPSLTPTSSESPSLTPTSSESPSLTPTSSESPLLIPMASESPSLTPTSSEFSSLILTSGESPSLTPTKGLSLSLVATDSSSEYTFTSFPSSPLSFPSYQTTIQPSVSSLVNPTSILSGSSGSKMPSTSSQTLVLPSFTPSVTTMMEPQSIVPIAASVVSVVVVLIICLVIIVCLFVFVQKRKMKRASLPATNDIDGTTEVIECQLFTLDSKRVREPIIGQPVEPSSRTFGKEPQNFEADLGTGIVFKFPETPTANTEDLPALIIYNPVKFDETIVSNTLPNHGKKRSGAQEPDALTTPPASEIKSSKSSSEVNKLDNVSTSLIPPDITNENSAQKTLTLSSPIYQTPRVLNTLANQNKDEVMNTNTASGEYVTMVAHSKVMSNDNSFFTGGDQLSPNQTTSTLEPEVPVASPNEESGESLYDNARLLRSKILNLNSPEKKLTSEKREMSSCIYDVPKSILPPLTTKSEVVKSKPFTENVLEQAMPISHDNSFGIYDIPRPLLVAREVKVSKSPLTNSKVVSDCPNDLSLSVVVPETREAGKEPQPCHKDTAIISTTKPSVHPKPNIALRKPSPYKNVSNASLQDPNQVSSANPDSGHDCEITPPRCSNDPSPPNTTSKTSAPYENVSNSFPQNPNQAGSANPHKDHIYDLPPLRWSNKFNVHDLMVKTQNPKVSSSASPDSDHKMPPSSGIGNNEVPDLEVSTKESDVTLSLECVKPKPTAKPRLNFKIQQLPRMPKNVLQELYAKQNVNIEVGDSVTAKIEELSSNIEPPVVKVNPPAIMRKPPAVKVKPHVSRVEPPAIKVKPPVVKPKPRRMS